MDLVFIYLESDVVDEPSEFDRTSDWQSKAIEPFVVKGDLLLKAFSRRSMLVVVVTNARRLLLKAIAQARLSCFSA